MRSFMAATAAASSPSPIARPARCRASPRLAFAVEVVHYFDAVAAALAAEDLPARRGAQQEDVSPADAVTPVEPVFDAFSRPANLERMCEEPQRIKHQAGNRQDEGEPGNGVAILFTPVRPGSAPRCDAAG